MFDTMTFTKIIGGFCGTLLVFLLGGWLSEILYHTGGGHGDEAHAQGYQIEVAASDTGAAEEEEPDFGVLLASADAGKGEKVFGKCKACHKLDAGAHATGPSLHAVVGRAIGGADGFGSYSGSLPAGEAWTPENLNAFLANPKSYAPGTTMSFSGLKKIEDRANLVAFLQQNG